ncbi:helix-turn-helix domain-containing protein [Metabacillus niabensis]|uniref:DNA-binding Lrp family transcriptional regulator n=1 Tax=Metabacillus niabensis TaxID=324854 RepID=A0ABT9Z130_9BACI|nr:helix-turn-helix domain-containing protein [Metabacillus niabensis]MDQ0225679.1 DNA-binding Lrp family transcriptional regulator [Metabacillus niabensis]
MEKLTFETIKTYQSFESTEEMDKAVRGFLYKHKWELSEGDLKVLQQIWRHSVKVIGVSFAKYEYIAEQANVSRRTAMRAVKKFVEKGLIKKIPTARMNGKQGVNILIIQPFASIDSLKTDVSPHAVTPADTPNKTEKKQDSLCEKDLKPNNVKKEIEPTVEQLDTSFLPDTVNPLFVNAAKPFFSAMDIYHLWKRVILVYNKMKLQKELEDVIDQVIYAFKQTVFAKKLGSIKSSFAGYFYGVLYSVLVVEKRKEMKGKYYDFLDEQYEV